MHPLLAAATIATSLLVPLTDLGPGEYAWGYAGGLWENGSNAIPADHLAAGLDHAGRIEPLDEGGHPSPDGSIVFLAVGGDEARRIFGAFQAAVATDPHVRGKNLVLANGAADGFDASHWIRETDPNYDRVKTMALDTAGVTALQVQAAWLDLSDDYPYSPLPIQDGNAYRLKGSYSYALHALKARYPNLQIVYLSSRVFGGYSSIGRNPEPYAYEAALSVRWIVVGQVLTMRTADLGPYWDSRIGDINYNHDFPWVSWGPYFWANGITPRFDGLVWERSDFEENGEDLSAPGAAKAGAFMLRSLLLDPTTANWFTATVPARRSRAVRP